MMVMKNSEQKYHKNWTNESKGADIYMNQRAMDKIQNINDLHTIWYFFALFVFLACRTNLSLRVRAWRKRKACNGRRPAPADEAASPTEAALQQNRIANNPLRPCIC
jgi:hypothetical protein